MLGQGTFLFWCARAPARALDADQLLRFPRDALQDKPSPDVGAPSSGLAVRGSTIFGARSSGLSPRGSFFSGARSSSGLARLGSLSFETHSSGLGCRGWLVAGSSCLSCSCFNFAFFAVFQGACKNRVWLNMILTICMVESIHSNSCF